MHLKYRKIQAVKTVGTRMLAGLMAAGMVWASPMSALAAEDASAPAVQAEAAEASQTEELRQAKKTDGSGELADISDVVREMIDQGEVVYNKETGYLEDAETKQPVDPQTGERMDALPQAPGDTDGADAPETPDEEGDVPADPEQPEMPDEEGAVPADPEQPGTPGEDPDTDVPENGGDGDSSGERQEDTKESESGEQEKTADDSGNAAGEETQPEDSGKGETPGSNEELVAAQQIVKLPEIVEDFRFWTVARKYAFAKETLYIREKMSEDADPAAEVERLLQDAKDDVEAAKEEAKRLKASYRKKNRKTENGKDFDKSLLFLAREWKSGLKSVPAAESLTGQARVVGSLDKNGLLYILKEEENGWLYVESGNVRGFVKASEVYTGDAAQELLAVYQSEAKRAARQNGEEYDGIEGTAKTAKARIAPSENEAYTYLRATVSRTVVEKKYALANEKVAGSLLNIREEGTTAARIVGMMEQKDLCYILADADADWVYVESGDVRGFVDAEYLDTGEETDKQVEESGEDAFGLAKETVEPKENGALYYTLTSVKEGVPDGEIRKSLLEYAAQFIGNPYVWGGTSLTDGADCSGFAQQIYKAYGYDLPRTARAQSGCGTKIAVEDAAPGDLIFYARNGSVYHVAVYAGDGKTIEAANEEQGIIQGTVNAKDAVWAVRVLEENYAVAQAGIGEVNATQEMYGDSLGSFTLTYYCSCEICCDVETGITATGAPVVEGRTIAVDPSVIPYGTQVIIGGHIFTAEDCGGAIKNNRIDIYVNDHQRALALGVGQAEVYLVK